MIKKVHRAAIIIEKGKEFLAREFYCGILGLTEIEKPSEVKKNGGYLVTDWNFPSAPEY